MADASGPSGGGYDYVQDSTNEPQNPREGQEWYQPDTDDVKTYDGGTWVDVKISDHGQLSGVSEADHHQPVTVNAPVVRTGQLLALAYSDGLTLDDSDQLALDLGDGLSISGGQLVAALGNGLGIDGSGRVYVAADYATASELTSHATNNSAHHSRYSDSEARSAVDGSNVSITGDAGTVDGSDATDLKTGTSTVSATDSQNISYSSGETKTVSEFALLSDPVDTFPMYFSADLSTSTPNPVGAALNYTVTIRLYVEYVDGGDSQIESLTFSGSVDESAKSGSKNLFVNDWEIDRDIDTVRVTAEYSSTNNSGGGAQSDYNLSTDMTYLS